MAFVSTNDFVSVPIASDLYQEVALRYPGRCNSLIADVVRDFLERTAGDEPSRRTKRLSGIHWDRVFLPDKTRLRTKYLKEYRYAEVKGDGIYFNGVKVSSVSRLARRMRGNTSVNAWLFIEIQRPGDGEWIKADVLRMAK